MDPIFRPLAALLAPMGPRLREALIACLPEPAQGAVRTRVGILAERAEAAETALERDLRLQAEAVWGGAEDREVPHPVELCDLLALLLRRARSPALAQALLQMPGDLPAEVLWRIAGRDLSRVSHRIQDGEAGAFFWRLRESLGDVRLKPIPDLAAKALKQIAPHTVRRILTAMARMNPETMAAVRDSAYSFEDLANLSDAELQLVLMGVENRDIALALQCTPAIVEHRLQASLSSRRQRIVEEEAALAGEVDESAARKAMARIVDRARWLYEAGQIHTYFGSVEGRDEAGERWRKTREAVHQRHAAWVRAWIRAPRRAGRQSLGVAVAGIALLLGGVLFLRGIGRMRGAPADRSETRAISSQPRQGRQVTRNELGEGVQVTDPEALDAGSAKPPPADGRDLELAGLRVSLSGGSKTGDPEDSPGTAGIARGFRLRHGTARVAVLDPGTGLETPVVRVTGQAGAAYRVRVDPDASTTVLCLRGQVRLQPTRGPGGPILLESGREARFGPSGEGKVRAGMADAEDLAWLERNR